MGDIVFLSFAQCGCLIVGECMDDIVFLSFRQCGLRVSYCGRVRGWRCLLSETVHLAHCHTATHAPTRGPELSLVQTSTNPRPAVLTVTGIMGRQIHAWSGMGEGGGVVEVLEGLGGKQLEGGSNLPSPKYGSRG